jgi:hypothetical protein
MESEFFVFILGNFKNNQYLCRRKLMKSARPKNNNYPKTSKHYEEIVCFYVECHRSIGCEC